MEFVPEGWDQVDVDLDHQEVVEDLGRLWGTRR